MLGFGLVFGWGLAGVLLLVFCVGFAVVLLFVWWGFGLGLARVSFRVLLGFAWGLARGLQGF